MSPASGIVVGDLVLIAQGEATTVGGCHARVDEVRDWGVIAVVLIPTGRGLPPAEAPARLAWANIVTIYKAVQQP